MKKNIGFILCALVINTYVYSQSVTIKGKAESYAGKSIAVWVHRDYISNIEKQLTFSEIDSVGKFTLEFESKEIQYVTLKIEKHIASMYIEPNKVYDVIIAAPDSLTYQNQNTEHDVNISLLLKSKTEINALTLDFDNRFDDFFTNEYLSFVARTPRPKIDSFKVAIKEFYSTVQNNYFSNYINYSIAALEEKTYSSRNELYDEYLKDSPVLYNHPEYFNFFNTFYKGYFQKKSFAKNGINLTSFINDRCNYLGLMDALKKDAFLTKDTIRELVAIKGLYEGLFEGYYDNDSVVKLLEMIRDSSKVVENKNIAQNIIHSFSKLHAGVVAPYFELPDKSGLTHSIDELRSSKYLYLVFFSTECTNCLQQLQVFTSFKKKYGQDIEFVSICVNGTFNSFKEFCSKNTQYDWLLLYDNTRGKLLINYEIVLYPTYFLISPDGKFLQVPADGPEEFIERTFYDLTKQPAKKVRVGDKRN